MGCLADTFKVGWREERGNDILVITIISKTNILLGIHRSVSLTLFNFGIKTFNRKRLQQEGVINT